MHLPAPTHVPNLGTLAPRSTADVPSRLPSVMDGDSPTSEVDWEMIRRHGPPSWTDGITHMRERLASLDAHNEDVTVRWATDPADCDGVELPVLELGHSHAPAMLVVAGQHGREPAAVAASLDWAEGLVAARNAGDPQAAWLLESRRIVLVPTANPRGLDRAMQAMRDARNGPDTAPIGSLGDIHPDDDDSPADQFMEARRNGSSELGGVDLNRNHPAAWSSSPGTIESDPRSEVYSGPSPASEPESRILHRLLDQVRPSVVVDLHQYGNFVMSSGGAPAAALRVANDRIASAARVLPSRVIGADVPGTLQGEGVVRGAALSVTLEAGRSFTTVDEDYPQVRSSVADALTALARAADAPVERLNGPDVGSAYAPHPHGFAFDVSDMRSGEAAIAQVELVADHSTRPGDGTPLAAADGAFDSPFEQVVVPHELATGRVGVRARDADGNWGPVTAVRVPDQPAGRSDTT